ncbi:DUF5004 domain-containing protein [bacterium]|nr:DUF5004 domain-containing protein [bacterium]
MKYLPIIALLLLLSACGAEAPLKERIVGSWDMTQVLHNGKDVTAEHDPKNTRSITFHDDGTFMSEGFPVGTNTGKWSIAPKTKELFIDSDAGEGDDSYWFVDLEGNRMVWEGARGYATEFTLIQTRIE